MSKTHEGGVLSRSGISEEGHEKPSFPKKFWFQAVLLLFIFIVLLSLLCIFLPDNNNSQWFSLQSKLPLSEMGENIGYSVLIRKNMNSGRVRRVYFRVILTENSNIKKYKAVAQKIIRDVLFYEQCHGIMVDFGPVGQVDFAPEGNWLLAGTVPANDYDTYQVNYNFRPSE